MFVFTQNELNTVGVIAARLERGETLTNDEIGALEGMDFGQAPRSEDLEFTSAIDDYIEGFTADAARKLRKVSQR